MRRCRRDSHFQCQNTFTKATTDEHCGECKSVFSIPSYSCVYTHTVRNMVSITFIRESRARSSIPFVTTCIKENDGYIHALNSLRSRKRRSVIFSSQEESHAGSDAERFISIKFERYEKIRLRGRTLINFQLVFVHFNYSSITRGCCGTWKRSSRADIYLDLWTKL